jgi:FkbM family methyltransferase
MIVEIGTCDFETQAGVADGLFIEPVKYYFDRLPPCRKENVAVSNYTGEIDIYYVDPDEIAARGLDTWLRGCNSVVRPHMQHARLPPEIVRKDTVPVVRIKSLLDKYEITEIDTLKIDTEGHDAIILNDFLSTTSIRPREIMFENNGLVPRADIKLLATRLQTLGYAVTITDGAGYALRPST